MKLLLVCFACCIILTCSAPSRVKYDQRQEGDLNIRADLENFVILVIPTSAGAAPSTLGLLDLLSKAIPMKGHNKRLKVRKPIHHATPSLLNEAEDDSAEETQSFIESKTAPYYVDISKSRKNLAKLHPNVEDLGEGHEELLVSPNLSLIKAAEGNDEEGEKSKGEELGRTGRMFRIPKGFVLSMPLEVEEDLVRIDNRRIEKSKDNKEKERMESKETRKKNEILKNKEKTLEPKLKLLLVGPEHHEECGPGYERGNDGVCKFIDHV